MQLSIALLLVSKYPVVYAMSFDISDVYVHPTEMYLSVIRKCCILPRATPTSAKRPKRADQGVWSPPSSHTNFSQAAKASGPRGMVSTSSHTHFIQAAKASGPWSMVFSLKPYQLQPSGQSERPKGYGNLFVADLCSRMYWPMYAGVDNDLKLYYTAPQVTA